MTETANLPWSSHDATPDVDDAAARTAPLLYETDTGAVARLDASVPRGALVEVWWADGDRVVARLGEVVDDAAPDGVGAAERELAWVAPRRLVERRADPRVAVLTVARVHVAGRVWPVALVEASGSGCRLSAPAAVPVAAQLRAGAPVHLTIGGGDVGVVDVDGKVVWAVDRGDVVEAGVAFTGGDPAARRAAVAALAARLAQRVGDDPREV